MNRSAHDQTSRVDYLSYLLRMWRESAGEGIWRASLEDPRTGERTGFASLEDLFAFLRQHIQDHPSDVDAQ